MPTNSSDPSHSIVVLVHGLAGNRLVMRPLERQLRTRGYATLNWRYWSLLGSIADHARRLARRVEELDNDPQVESIHFVGHSLGCILTRVVLAEQRPAKLGRVVMLAPPNRGSPVATRMRPYLSWMLPVVPQLSDQADSFVNCLPRSLGNVDIGVLAAATDILVPLENTHLESLGDHHTLACRHLTILFRGEVAELVDRFLREGSFGESR